MYRTPFFGGSLVDIWGISLIGTNGVEVPGTQYGDGHCRTQSPVLWYEGDAAERVGSRKSNTIPLPGWSAPCYGVAVIKGEKSIKHAGISGVQHEGSPSRHEETAVDALASLFDWSRSASAPLAVAVV